MRRFCAAALVFLMSARCATVINGRYQNVEVQSSPSGAKVQVDCGGAPRDGGTTPAIVRLRRGALDCRVHLIRDGYRPAIVEFTRRTSRQVWANAIPAVGTGLAAGIAVALANLFDGDGDDRANAAFAGGIVVIGGAAYLIDRNSGALYKQEPPRVEVTLDRAP
jgi:hypothetical protein